MSPNPISKAPQASPTAPNHPIVPLKRPPAPQSVASSLRGSHDDVEAAADAPPRPPSLYGPPPMALVTPHHSTESSAFALEVQAAKARGLGALSREVGQKTHAARAIPMIATAAGLGLSFGLLVSGHAAAAFILLPLFVGAGLGIAWWMRSRINKKPDPSIEAFKQLMAEAGDATEGLPEFAQARKVYSFLNDGFARQACLHLHDVYAKAARLVGRVSKGGHAQSVAPEMAQRHAPDEQAFFDDAASHASDASSISAHEQSPASSSIYGSHESSVEYLPQTTYAPELRASAKQSTAPNVEPLPEVSESFGDASFVAPALDDAPQNAIDAWRSAHPGVDPNRTFSVEDMTQYDTVQGRVLQMQARTVVPTWELRPQVLAALGIEEEDRFTTMHAGDLKTRLRWT